MSLTFDRLRAVNVERAKAFPSAKQNWTAADWMTALVGEVGELANLLKKLRRGVDLSRGQSMEEIRAQLAGELGDIQTYLDLLAANLGVDLGRATIEKFNEVSKRVGSPLTLHGSLPVNSVYTCKGCGQFTAMDPCSNCQTPMGAIF